MSASRHTYAVVVIVAGNHVDSYEAICFDWRVGKYAAYGRKAQATAFRDTIAAEFPKMAYRVIQLR